MTQSTTREYPFSTYCKHYSAISITMKSPVPPLTVPDTDIKDTSTLEERLLDTPDTPRSIPRSTSMSSLASAGLYDNPQEVPCSNVPFLS